jgi:hypothetical protein
MVHRGELRDAMVQEAPSRLLPVLLQADGCLWATDAWDASDGALRDAAPDESPV